jgi:hypothetical protein
VLASPLGRKPAFADALVRAVRARVLPALVERVRVEWWDESIKTCAENAAWLALASAFYDGWHDSAEHQQSQRTPQDAE